jgi:hypothetical protein
VTAELDAVYRLGWERGAAGPPVPPETLARLAALGWDAQARGKEVAS